MAFEVAQWVNDTPMVGRSVQNDRYRLSGTYERLKRTLEGLPEDGRLDKALAYWVLPTDRRLPIAFLDRSLRDLLSEPLEDLMATQGVGQKKILGFFDLLRRAAKATTLEAPFGLSTAKNAEGAPINDPFDPATVSEAVWATWRETVNRCGFRSELLGRLAPTLQSLPTVIWQVPLANYADRTLAEIRGLKTHGQKRVSAILEVFCTVHEAASVAVLPETIDLHLAPRFVAPATRWLLLTAGESRQPATVEVKQQLIQPLVKQVEIDLGTTVANLVADRLMLSGDTPTVKQQADALGVTRARVYQLLDDCARAMAVRWPEGRWLIAAIASQYKDPNGRSGLLIRACHELFYPEDRPVIDRTTELHAASPC